MDSVNISTILAAQNHRPALTLCLPKYPSIVKNVTTTLGMGDHLAVQYDVACEVTCNTTLRQKLFKFNKFNKTNIPNMAQDMNSLHQTLREDWSCHTAEENWTCFHNALTNIMKQMEQPPTDHWCCQKKYNEEGQGVQKSKMPKFLMLKGGAQSPEELHQKSHSTRPWTLCPRHHWWPELGYLDWSVCRH